MPEPKKRILVVEDDESITLGSVSYTHLTLPTSDLVEISVVAASLKKKNTHRKTNETN